MATTTTETPATTTQPAVATPEQDVKITTSGAESLSRTSEAMGRIFADDPAIHYMLSNLPVAERRAYLPHYIHVLLAMAALNGGIFQEIGGWSCMAIWLPPGRKLDGLVTILRVGFSNVLMKSGVGGIKRMIFDFQNKANAYKRKAMKGRKRFHYLFFIGTEQEARGRGLASRIIAEFQKKAQQDGLPIWLEASTSHSRDVYARQGFELVGEIAMGVGTHAASGEREKGGPGVRVYPMIWEPAPKNGVHVKPTSNGKSL